ncbi:copia protein [Tanacetum coccineum]
MDLIGNLKFTIVIIRKISEIVEIAKVEENPCLLKAKKEYSDEDGSSSEVKITNTPWHVSRLQEKFFKRSRCDDPNHLIGECPKPPKDKNQRAFVGGSWSDSDEEDDEKVKDETCLVAQASNEVCSESSYFSDENSSIDDLVLDNEYDKMCKMSSKIIIKNKRLKATRNSLEKELSILKEKVLQHEKEQVSGISECENCHMLKIENEKLKEEANRLTKFEKSTHCLNEMLSNQKTFREKIGLGFNSFEASSSGTKEIKFVKSQKTSSGGSLPNAMGGPLKDQTTPKVIKGPPVCSPVSEKSVSFQKSILGSRPNHIMVNNVKVPVASDNEGKRFYKLSLKPRVEFSKPNVRSKTPPPRRVNNNYPRPKTPQPKRNVGRQNQPHGFPCRVHTFSEHNSEITKDGKCHRKVEESLNVTFDETHPPSKTSPLVDDDLDKEEAIKAAISSLDASALCPLLRGSKTLNLSGKLYLRYIKGTTTRDNVAGDGVASIKRRRRDQSSDGVRILATASRRGRLKEDLELSTWRRRQDCKATSSPSNWLERLPTGSISTWEDLTTRFLAQFFPPRWTTKLRNDILMFQQHHGESLSEALTRFKDLLQKVPHHGIDRWLQIQIFYDHFSFHLKCEIDRAAGGKLRDKNADESWEIIENLALYDHEGWNDTKEFVKLVKAISTPQKHLTEDFLSSKTRLSSY